MEMTVHHQKTRVIDPKYAKSLTQPRRICVGEDARPYAKDGILIIADGLGGRGGFPHSRLNPEILDRDRFYDTVFMPVLGDADGEFKEFVLDSFSELFLLKDCYFDSSVCMRTSGYFASRLISAIVLHTLRYDPVLNRDAILSLIADKEDSELANCKLQWVGNELAELIKIKLKKVSENMCLEFESKTVGSYLLPSTLIVTLYKCCGDHTDTVNLWAGDSRCYIWDENGLAQITDDHERDETMYNLVSLTKPFVIEVQAKRFYGPLLLFNSTDGCYKCPCFASPFDLECLILQDIKKSNSLDGLSEILDGRFAEVGTHDDSNSIALAAIGYEDFNGIKAAAAERQKYIDENIIARLPDILEVDYAAELASVDEQMSSVLYGIKNELFNAPSVKEFTKNYIKFSGYIPYTREMRELKARSSELSASDAEMRGRIKELVCKHWIRLPRIKSYAQPHKANNLKREYDKCDQYEQQLSASADEYKRLTDAVLGLLQTGTDSLLSSHRELSDTLTPSDREGLETVKTLREALAQYESVLNGKQRCIQNFAAAEKSLKKINDDYVKADKEVIELVVNAFINGDTVLSAVPFDAQTRDMLDRIADALQRNREERKMIEESLSGLEEKYAPMLWNERAEDLISKIWKEKREIIPSELMAVIDEAMADLNETRRLLCADIELRSMLYTEYEKTYNRFLCPSKLADAVGGR